ncbi:hypothetical protein NY406_01520 [Chlorobaculum sp. MV4-Y]|jgi:hypothetical protein|uniref:hypothetical protein n=1 Tax=Chlorobaculum sp. MV4-Y TaxID=2976335 RepID=UPI0021AE3CE2|nr:hypothetical protein [Chlorobaculum sp. MV4-Y]UWX57981.1 hypothetical protein NY406_01520 [Chlorobaculum sp. MV4-Y]
MKQRFVPALIIVLAMSGFFSGASVAADSSPAVPKKAATTPESGKTVAKDVPKPGGWSRFELLSSTDRAVFKETMAGLTGVGYEPLAVRKQAVEGVNYEFFCNARAVYPGTDWHPAMVMIYKPLKGNAVIKKISKIDVR